jgi:hypothetical protein
MLNSRILGRIIHNAMIESRTKVGISTHNTTKLKERLSICPQITHRDGFEITPNRKGS